MPASAGYYGTTADGNFTFNLVITIISFWCQFLGIHSLPQQVRSTSIVSYIDPLTVQIPTVQISAVLGYPLMSRGAPVLLVPPGGTETVL